MRDFNRIIIPAFKNKKQVIIISESIYDKINKHAYRKEDFKKCVCPVCSGSNFTYHCQYHKYYYQKYIVIIRVKCLDCRSTHALIPDFSLPGTSIGTEEADKYIDLRLNGVSQVKASKIFISLGMSKKYGIIFERRMKSSVQKAMAIFPHPNDILHNPLLLFQYKEELSGPVILTINNLFLQRGCNPLLFSRNNILMIREIKSGKDPPLNKEAVWPVNWSIDSG